MKFISDNPSKQKQEIMVMMLLFLCFLYIGCNAGNFCNKHIPKNEQKKLPTNMKTKNVNVIFLIFKSQKILSEISKSILDSEKAK